MEEVREVFVEIEGLQTLINEIMGLVSKEFRLEEEKIDPIEKMIFELCLMTNQAWVLAHTGLSHPKPFYLKRFNDGAIEGSGPYEFLKKLVEDHPEGGEVEFSFADKSESIPKAIQRIGLRGLARDLFFGPSRGNKVIFHGVRIALPRDQKCRNLLTELEDMHKKAGAPEYNICLL